jgi:hypothetical protein
MLFKMKVGVTGTREGMNKAQFEQVKQFLEKYTDSELHHGDCRGVDVEVALLAKGMGYKIVCHPPKSNKEQGHFGGDDIREPQTYLKRDRNIVDETDILLVVPLQNERQDKGGTWYTYDYALKTGKTVHMAYPG